MKSSRLLAFIYLIATLIIMPGSVLLSIVSNQDSYSDLSLWPDESVEVVKSYYARAVASGFEAAIGTGLFILLCGFALCFCGKAFSYMHARRSVDLYHAVPVRRTPMLMGKYIAILVRMLAPLTLSTALCHVLVAVNQIALAPSYFWMRFVDMALLTAACVTFVMLFMVVSGTLPSAFLTMVCVTIGWPVLMNVADITMSRFLPGYVSVMADELNTLFSPFFGLMKELQYSFLSVLFVGYDDDFMLPEPEMSLSPWLLWWVALTVVMLALAIFYYNRRKSETAENYFSFPVIRGIVRGLMAIVVGLETGLVLGDMLDSNAAYLAGVLAGAAAAHIFYQFVLTHSFRGFWKTIPAFGLSVVVAGGFLGALYTGGLGYVTRVPDAAEVEKVEFNLPSLNADGGMEGYLAQRLSFDLHDRFEEYLSEPTLLFSKEEDIAAIGELHAAIVGSRYAGPCQPFENLTAGSSYDFTVTYTLKNGREMKRSYWFYIIDSDADILDSLAKVQKLDALQAYCIYYSMDADKVIYLNEGIYADDYEYTAYNDQLTTEEQQQIWDTFVEELNSDSFYMEPDLMTAEELELYQIAVSDSSGWQEAAEETAEEATSHDYTIGTGRIRFADIAPEMRAIIEEQYADNIHNVDYVTGGDFWVPECCPRTRQLIHDFTEEYGTTYTYGEAAEDDVDWYD